MLWIRAYHRTDVYIFILESKNWTPTLRMTYIKTCFINILIQISSTYTVLTGGTEVAWLTERSFARLKHQAPLVLKHSSKPLPSFMWLLAPPAVCFGPLLVVSVLGADVPERMMPRVSSTVCHLLPFAFMQPRSHSCSEATVAHSLLPLLWGHRFCCSGRGDSCRQGLPAIKPTAALLPHAEMLHTSVLNSVETNTLSDSQLEKLIFKQYLTIPGKRHTETY